MILKGESAEEFNRKADENYEKFKARQKQNIIDMMEADEKLGLYEKHQPTEDVEALSKDDVLNYERERYERFSNGNHALSHLHMANQCTISYEEGFTKGYQLAKKVLRDRTSYRTSSKGFLDNSNG